MDRDFMADVGIVVSIVSVFFRYHNLYVLRGKNAKTL